MRKKIYNKMYRKVIASVTAVCMMMEMFSVQVGAGGLSDADLTEEQIQDNLLTLVDEKEYPKGMFEFLSPRIEVEEGTSYVEFAVVRAGNTDEKASVTFKAVDISAKYGEDYKITEKGLLLSHTLEAAECTKSMGEQMVTNAQSQTVTLGETEGQEVSGEGYSVDSSGTLSDDSSIEATISDDAANISGEANDISNEVARISGEATDISNEASNISGVVADISNEAIENSEVAVVVTEKPLEVTSSSGADLRSARELLTGKQSDTSVWSEQSESAQESTDDALIAAYKNTYADMPGAECVLEFAPGENMKKLKFYITDDEIAEDDELAMLVLSDAVNCALSDNPTGLVNIKDNDTYDKSTYSIEEDSIDVSSDEDKAVLTVRRESGITHYGEVTIRSASGTAQSGEYYDSFAQTLTFSAGQEYQKVEIPIKKHPEDGDTLSFGVSLDDSDKATIHLMPVNNAQDVSGVSMGVAENMQTMDTSDPWTARVYKNDICNGNIWSYIISDGNYSRRGGTYDVDMSMVGKVEFTAKNISDGTRWETGAWFWKDSGYYTDFVTYFGVGQRGGKLDKWGKFSTQTNSFICNDNDRSQTKLYYGTKCEGNARDSYARFSKINLYYLPIKVRLCDSGLDNGKESVYTDRKDKDAWLYTKTYTASDTYTENENSASAKYIGGIKFSSGDYWSSQTNDGRTREKIFYGTDQINMKEDLTCSELSDEEKKNIYLWGFKIESKDMKNIGYYYVEGDNFSIKDLFTGNLYGYYLKSNGDKVYGKVNVSNTRMTDGDYYAFNIYPVYRQKTAYVRMTIDENKSTFSTGTFGNNDVTVMGMMDTVKYNIVGKGSNIVQGYNLYAQNDSNARVTSNDLERRIYYSSYQKNNNKADNSSGTDIINRYSPYDITTGNLRGSDWPIKKTYTPEGVVKGEISITPATSFDFVKDEIHLVANYETPSILMTVHPAATFASAQSKAFVTYSDALTGKEQTATFEGVDKDHFSRGTTIDVNPFKNGTTYNFRAVLTDSDQYQVLWTDMTGDTNSDGKISSKEKAALGKYANQISDDTFYGDVFNYTPTFMAQHKLYYRVSAKDPNETGLKGTISGYVYCNSKTVVENTNGSRGTSTALAGVQVVVGGQTTYTDSKGYFKVESTDFMTGCSYNVTFNKDGRVFSATAQVNRPMSKIVLDEYTTFNVTNFKAYTISDKSQYKNVQDWQAASVNLLDVSNKDCRNLFTFKIDELSTETVGKVEVNCYSSTGTLKKTFAATYEDGIYIVNPTLNEAGNTENGYYSFNPATENISGGDYLTIRVYDQNGIAYSEHKVGMKFQKYLSTINLANSFKSPFNGVIEFIGQADTTLDLGVSAALDEKLSNYITISTVEDEETGTLTKTFSAGWNKDWKGEYDANKSAEEKAKEEAKKKPAEGSAAPQVTSDTQKNKTAKELVDKDSKESEENEKKSNLTSNYSIGIKVAFSLSMKQDKNSDRWYFNDFVVVGTLSGSSEFKYNYTTPIGITIYISGGLSGDVTAIMGVERYKNNKLYFDAEGTKEDPRIDLTQIGMTDVNRTMNFYGELSINPSIKLGAGVGIDKVASVTLNGTADFAMTFRASGNGAGKVKLTGELILSMVGGLVEKKWLLGQYQYDLFNYNDGNVSSNINKMKIFEDGTDYRYEKITSEDAADRSYLDGQNKWNKNSELRSHIASVGVERMNETLLLSHVYPQAYPLIDTIGVDETGYQSDQIMVFLHDDGSQDDYNRSQLMYSINENGRWSEPLKVDNDSTNDDSPLMYNLGNDKVLIVWSSANKKLNESMNAVDMMNSRNIKARFFDTKTRTFGDVTNITQETEADQVSDDTPCFSYCNKDGKEYLMVSYVKSQYTASTGEDAVVGDILNPYSSIAYRFYDFENEKWVDQYSGVNAGILETMSPVQQQVFENNWYGQGFVDLSQYVDVDESGILNTDTENGSFGTWSAVPTSDKISLVEGNSDPSIKESESIGYDGKSLSAYVVDMDKDAKTLDDKEIFLQMYDFEQDRFYPAIRLTDDEVEQSYVELEENEQGGVSLFYISDGDIVEFDATQLLSNGYYTQDKDGKDVVLINKADEGYTQPTVVYESEENMPITEYIALSDGDNMFLAWSQEQITYKHGIDPTSKEATDPENYFTEHQLYMMMKSGKYVESTVTDENGETLLYPTKDDEGNTINWNTHPDVNGETGQVKAGDEVVTKGNVYNWSKPITMTDDQGANYTDIDFVLAAPGVLRCVYLKGMSEVMEVDGAKMSAENTNARSLMTADYDLNATEYKTEFTDLSPIVSGKENVPVEINVKNETVLSRSNVEVELYEGDTLIGTKTIDSLGGGEEDSVNILWNVPEDIEGVTLTAKVVEGGLEESTIQHTFEYIDDWTISDVTTQLLDREQAQVSATVVNNGAQSSNDLTLQACLNENTVTSEAFDLNVGEEKTVTWNIPITDRDFTSETAEDGSITESAVVVVKGMSNQVESTMLRTADSKLVDMANNMKNIVLKNLDTEKQLGEKITLSQDEYLGLDYEITTKDGSEVTPFITCSSADESIVGVENDVLIGGKKGTTDITVTIAPDVYGFTFSDDENMIRKSDITLLPSSLIQTMKLSVQVTGDDVEPTQTPAPTIEPTATPEPGTTNNPSATPEPGTTNNPSATPVPGTTNNPSATPVPGTTTDPTATQEPVEITGPDKTLEPGTTLAPDSTTVVSDKPAQTTAQAVTTQPVQNSTGKATANSSTKVETSASAKTGDTSRVVVWLILAVLSCGIVVRETNSYRKRKKLRK